MPYDAKPKLHDVMLTAWEAQSRKGIGTYLYVAMYVRTENGRGEMVGEWVDDACARMFENGLFKREGTRDIHDSDRVLAKSVFEHADKHNLGALAWFEKEILDAMSRAETKLTLLHHALGSKYGADEDFDAVQAAAGDALTSSSFPALSSARLHDIHDHLQDLLEGQLNATVAPAP